MTLTQELLGTRLRDARVAANLTQEAVGEALGIPRTAVVQMEAGKRSVSTLEITRLAELFGRSIASLVAADAAADDADALVAFFRLVAGQAAAPWKQDVERCVAVCRAGADLKRLLELPGPSSPPAYEPPTPTRKMDAVRQGADAARHERRRLGLGSGPIPDMADLLNGLGIWATGADLPAGMAGVFLQDREAGLVILVMYGDPRARKRFSYAHEYAHALFDRQSPAVVSWENDRDTIVETRANAFAAEFLLPEEGVRVFLDSRAKGGPVVAEHLFPEPTNDGDASRVQRRAPAGSQRVTFEDAARLAQRYGVAYMTAVYRLKNTSAITDRELQHLLAQDKVAARYTQILDPAEKTATEHETATAQRKHPGDRSLVPEVMHLAIEAYRRELISPGKLRDLGRMLGMPAGDLVELAEAASA
jgi:Zn-dependent peptidase ImmA (M78 family)/transcriptional regulator with XRE-family HTH domain